METENTHSLEETADVLGVSIDTIRNWRRLSPDHPNYLPAVKLDDGVCRYTTAAIIKWVLRPEHELQREAILAARFVPPEARDWFSNSTPSANPNTAPTAPNIDWTI